MDSFHLSDRRDSNPRPAAWEAAALPTELLSHLGVWWPLFCQQTPL